MLEVETPEDLDGYVGQALGVSDWVEVSQARIDQFAEATGDHQWIHVDPARAAKELPGGATIAHGFLTLSLLPMLSASTYSVRHKSRGVNYGSNKVRFTSPVPSGSRVRGHFTLVACETVEGGRRLTTSVSVEIEGAERPALVAETVSIVYGV